MYTSYIHQLLKSYAEGLPGEPAQNHLAPVKRKSARPTPTITPKQSAVLLLIYPVNNVPHIALMQRQSYDGVHSGQISLPGGKVEPEDQSNTDTALREANEELGIQRELVEIIGPLTSLYIPPSNFMVHPLLGYSHQRPGFVLEQKEVAKLIEAPVHALLTDENIGEHTVKLANGIRIKTPAYTLEDQTLWGATAMILSELQTILSR